MNRERARELLPIIQAYADGKVVQVKFSGPVERWSSVEDPTWFACSEYRIKPEPLEHWCISDGEQALGNNESLEACEKSLNELRTNNPKMFDKYEPVLFREVIE